MKLELGIGFFGLLTLVFVIAKILGKLDWSWWMVFIPIWAYIAIVLVVFIIMAIWWLSS